MKDTSGNILYIQEGIIRLQLVNEPHPRKIGKLIESTSILQVNRDYNNHLFRQTNSYGFNETIIRTATKFDKVELIEKRGDDTNKYLIPLQVIKEKGTYLNFKQQGFEIQIFLKLDIIQQYKTN